MMKLVFKAVCVFPLALGTAALGQMVLKYGACSIDTDSLPLPDCALETRNGRTFVLHDFADDVFSGRVRGIAAHPASVGHHRLAWTYLSDGGWAYFDRSGLLVVQNVAADDNSASEFRHGLVPVTKEGKWGLADVKGNFIVPLIYDGMIDSIEHGGWLVCSGCKTVHQGDHSWPSGGKWIQLDRRGRAIGAAPDPFAHLGGVHQMI